MINSIQRRIPITSIFTNTFEPITNCHLRMLGSHIHWQNRLYNAIANQGRLDSSVISRDDCCDFGRWLHNENTRKHLGHLHRYHNCVEKHAAFHTEAGRVVKLIDAKKYDSALWALNSDSDFERASAAVVASIFPAMFDPLSGSEDYWNTKSHFTMQTSGCLPAIGSEAPDFCLVNSQLENVSLANYAGKHKILNILPSLDIPSCMAVTRKFNQKKFHSDHAITLTISVDLPFTQQRLYEISGLRDIVTLSTFRATFAEDYGVKITSGHLVGLMSQAVVVLDEQNKVLYTQFLEDLNQTLDYEAIFAALKHSDETLVLQQLSERSSDDIPELAILPPANRRECFRIDIPTTNPCYCKIALFTPSLDATVEYKNAYVLATNKIQNRLDEELKRQHGVSKMVARNGGNGHYCMQINLHDVSSSGCSMVNYDEEFSYFLKPHTIYDNCTIFIPNHGEVKINLEIMSKRKMEDSNIHGFNELIGITFVGMEQAVEVEISSYVQEIERQRISAIRKHVI